MNEDAWLQERPFAWYDATRKLAISKGVGATAMSPTAEELDKRVAVLEQELAQLRAMIQERSGAETSAERGARLWREAALSGPALAAAWVKALEEMGIRGEPIGAQKVREIVAGCGVRPEDNVASRGIIAMREE